MRRFLAVLSFSVLVSSPIQASVITAINLLPTCTINPSDRVVLEVILSSETYPTYLFQPTEIARNGRDITVDIFATSGLHQATSSLPYPVEVGNLSVGTYNATIRLHGVNAQIDVHELSFQVVKKRCPELGRQTPQLYWVDGFVIKAADLDARKIESIVATTSISSIALDSGRGQIYWSNLRHGLIERIDVNGANRVVLFDRPDQFAYPYALVFDQRNHKLFWVDYYDYSIWRSELDGSDAGAIIENHLPDRLFVDEIGANLYWAFGSTLYRSDFDGTSVNPIVSDLSSPVFLAVDSRHQQVYWNSYVDYESTLFRSDLDGNSVETLFAGSGIVPTSLLFDVVPGKIYWTNDQYQAGALMRGDTDGTNLETLVPGRHGLAHDLVFDRSSQRLFWLDYLGVRSSNIDGSDFRTLTVSNVNPLQMVKSTSKWYGFR